MPKEKKEKPPKPEELIERLFTQLEELREEMKADKEETSKELEEIRRREEEMKETVEKNKEEQGAKMEDLRVDMKEELSSVVVLCTGLRENLGQKISELQKKLEASSSSSAGAEDMVQEVMERVEAMQEKLYDFEVNKRNNLIFYGVPGEARETPRDLMTKISSLLRVSLSLQRELGLTSTSRLNTGPEVAGCRPVVVTFEEYKDREEVLRKANLLKGSNIHVTEDMSRRVRECRQELRKYMRTARRANPAVKVMLQYDKLYVDGKCYAWNDVQGRVTENTAETETSGNEQYDRSASSLGYRAGSQSPTKSRPPSRSLSSLSVEQEDALQEQQEEIQVLKEAAASKEDQVQGLQEQVRLLEEKLAKCDTEEEKSEQ